MGGTARALAAGLLVLCAFGAAPARAQRNDGADNAPSEQRIADELRAAGSKCDAPACHNNADGVYPPSTGQGYEAKTPSISAGQTQPND